MKKFIGMIVVFVVISMVVGSCFGDDEEVANPLKLRCRVPGEYCSRWQGKYCCEGLKCEGPSIISTSADKCVRVTDCLKVGRLCTPGRGRPCGYQTYCHEYYKQCMPFAPPRARTEDEIIRSAIDMEE